MLRTNNIYAEVVDVLQKYPDLDRMLGGLSSAPKQLSVTSARKGIDTLLFVKEALKLSKELVGKLHGFTHAMGEPSELLQAIAQSVWSDELAAMEVTICTMLPDGDASSRSQQEMRHQECFAIKSGVDGLLDVARKTYLQTVEEIYQLAEHYSQHQGIALTVNYSVSRGYFLSLPVSAASDPLPELFIQAVLHKKTLSCSTMELKSLSDRANESITQALTLTNQLVESLHDSIRSQIDGLFAMVDSVALLDMLASFADLVALSPQQFSAPKVVDDGPLVIKAGRHPILSSLPNSSSFVANDFLMSAFDNVHIVSGPNGSGKSVFIKQVALIVVMAQIGCFVPAQFASVPVRSHIMSRIGTSDDLENNMSTFAVEMKEIAYVLNNSSKSTLVVIDELGRGTSNIDGISLAFAVGEALLDSYAMVLFVTHFPQITQLSQLYANAKNVHLKIRICSNNTEQHSHSDASSSGLSVQFVHEVGAGPSELQSGYGVMLAELCALPGEVLQCAKQRREHFREQYHLKLLERSTDKQNAPLASSLLHHVVVLLKHADLSYDAVKNYLHMLQQKLPEITRADVLSFLDSSS